MKHILTLLLSFAAGTLSAQFIPYASWEYLNPIPQAASLYSVKMIDSMTYIAVGEGGTVVRTFDDGATWKVDGQVHNITSTFTSVDFCSPSTGIVAAKDYILFTNDSGNTWKRSYFEDTYGVLAVCYASPSRAFCVGRAGEFYASSDSGKSWLSKRLDTAVHFHSICFLTPEIGLIGTNMGTLLRTTDGGATWNYYEGTIDGSIDAIDFRDSLNGALCGMASISHTSDGGNSWHKSPITPTGNANDITMLSPERIVAACDRREILVSEDAGNNWTDVEPFGSWKFRGISFAADRRNGVVVGNNGLIMRTRDGGKTWIGETETVTSEPYSLNSVWCFDSLTAVACGRLGTILRTTDGGYDWTLINIPSTATFYDVHFQTPLIGTIVGSYGTIYRTHDGGLNWEEQRSLLIDEDLRHVSFSDTANGVACGLHGTFRMTSNGGKSWVKITSSSDSVDFLGIEYISSSTIIATATTLIYQGPGSLYKDTYILRSTNQGVFWDTVMYYRGVGPEYSSLDFISEKVGYCVQNTGNIGSASLYGSLLYKTTDGGLTWDTTRARPQILSQSMSFINEHSGTIVGADGVASHTSDGGHTWANVPNVTTLDLRSVSHGSLNGAFAVGYKTAILRLTTNDTLVTLSTPISAASRDELVRNIYPNPARDVVTIEFALAKPMSASLAIYNLEGKRVGIIHETHYGQGIQSVQYDVSNFAAGFYFIEITAENKREMVKFIVQ